MMGATAPYTIGGVCMKVILTFVNHDNNSKNIVEMPSFERMDAWRERVSVYNAFESGRYQMIGVRVLV